MKEILYEETAFPYDYKRQKVYYIIDKVLIGIAIAFCCVWAFLFLLSDPTLEYWWVFPVLNFALSVISAVFFFFLKRKFYNCYDYIFVTGDVRIVKVVNTKRRKKVILFDSKDVYGIGRFESDTFEKFKNAPGVKIIYAPTNKFVADKPKYYIGVTVDGVKHLLVLECSEKFLSYILHFSGKQVLEKEF